MKTTISKVLLMNTLKTRIQTKKTPTKKQEKTCFLRGIFVGNAKNKTVSSGKLTVYRV